MPLVSLVSLRSSKDSDLEAFSRNPTDGAFAQVEEDVVRARTD